jgi:hypothetical protein
MELPAMADMTVRLGISNPATRMALPSNGIEES